MWLQNIVSIHPKSLSQHSSKNKTSLIVAAYTRIHQTLFPVITYTTQNIGSFYMYMITKQHSEFSPH